MTTVRTWPHDAETERALLSLALVEAGETLAACDGVVRDSDFYAAGHSAIWHALLEASKAGAHVDTVLVESQLKLAGKLEQCRDALQAVHDRVPSGDAHAYATRIRDLAVCRTVMRRSLELLSAGERPLEDVDGYLELAASAFTDACDRRASAKVRTLDEVLHESYDDLVRRQNAGSTLTGYATGLHDLDQVLTGLCPGDLIVLAARPGMGKSALASRMLLGVARSTGKPALVLSLEMRAVQVGARMQSSEAHVDLRRMRAAKLTSSEIADVLRFTEVLSKLPVHFLEERDACLADLRREAKRLSRTKGQLGLVVVDYLQLMRAGRREQNREREVAELSRGLKALADELQCPVLALSQLNRGVEGRSDKRPMLGDLRESGAIEQDADAVLFIYRDEVYNAKTESAGIAEVIVAKQRSGPVGMIKLAWAQHITRFDNLERHQQEELTYEQP